MEYNWLLTTIAQSSAALVGISSGFLILRINMLFNVRRDIRSDIKECENKFEEAFDLYRGINGKGTIRTSGRAAVYVVGLKQSWDELNKRLKEFPYRIFIGIIGIFWLIGFSIIYPVSIIPQANSSQAYFNNHYTWCFFKTTYFLKWTFGIGIGWLVMYLIVEIIKYLRFKEQKIVLNSDILGMIKHFEQMLIKNEEIRRKNKK